MLCLLICAAYLVSFRIDIMCTKVSCCADWVLMSWFTCVLMLFTSFVVAVPLSHLRASPRKGNRLLLWLVLLCVCPSNEGSVFRRLIAKMMVGLQELHISLIVVSSTWSGDNKWEGAAGWWVKDSSSWHVLSICLLKYFQWFQVSQWDLCSNYPWMAHGISLQNNLKKNWLSYFYCSWGSSEGDHAYHAVMKMSVNYLQCRMSEQWYQLIMKVYGR